MIFEGQIELRIGALSLTLDNCDFFAEENNPLGYTSDPNSEGSTVNVSLLPFGAVSVLKIPSKLREFQLDITLSYERALTLQAILIEHQERLENKSADAHIVMVDQRVPVMEKLPRIRARKGVSLTDLTVPAGYERYYPIYAMTLSAPELERSFYTKNLSKITLTGHEMFILDTSNDEI